MNFTYYPKGVCSRQYDFEIEDGILKDIKIIGGCNGNLQGIAALIKGQKVEDIIPKIRGINCNFKGTSCPDQISKALEEALAQMK